MGGGGASSLTTISRVWIDKTWTPASYSFPSDYLQEDQGSDGMGEPPVTGVALDCRLCSKALDNNESLDSLESHQGESCIGKRVLSREREVAGFLGQLPFPAVLKSIHNFPFLP